MNATVYIATDEANSKWFATAFHNKRFRGVYFLNDFIQTELQDISPNYYGFIDQLVAARGEAFLGPYYSTFTAHILHFLGYHSQVEQRPGFQEGKLNAYYYAPEEFKYVFRKGYRTIPSNELFEVIDTAYPMAWRDIDP
eukprot:CAMPEP_0178896946 /NCGR_PEP_ID=MMETSP0786-20121207/1468_1 /TAXON_ID=186022 /ORGANISM="Thalassionema frauenfeldii, Strain CCMP 1798" /LENGTH=138 /DNA_ID=CAMNT_0020567431 /DNA_START=681 /DNA_END=1097 /DNA_ORIENTATION=-